ncbi:monofunctional biosynthetic peptidoglycan transglycosylase [Pseudoprevotella muciniphila]|uniref:Biosynthetic peptidoglycan transglycosylase n=1 Tax=Pseudoprevotella muciniphila TaxID=2133944 RepID=A0A5P8E513_9BACT|nr:monofunctional biosynthetic peptidoglycan transglycosylase [Pseudoprevotella muciniphila]QFQ12129.1 monofunctional biosynthetic peptidoglycan transglycosylase [Pseudoprevotella muciniphila]
MASITASKIMVKTLKWVAILFFTSSIGMVLVYRFVPVPLTPLMLIRSAEQKMAGKPVVMEHDWVPMEEISPNLVTAVIASEDQNFTRHSGFDITAIEQAAKEYAEGRRKRGGSTISQQTAKNVFLWPQSSWLRKGFEAYFTFLIELFWSKERIMEVYLNSIEMGNGIYGAEAVAKSHFNTTAAKLTKRQSALIAATLPNPLKFSSKNPSRYVSRRVQQIEVQMNNVRRDGLDLKRHR